MKKKNEDGSRRRLHYDLTDTDIKKAKLPKPPLKYYDLRDGKGLYLRITSTDNKIWKIDYYVNKKRNTMTLGYYPQMSLQMAREEAKKAKQLAKQGTNPNVDKQRKIVEEQKQKDEESRTFKDVANEWLEEVVDLSSNVDKTKKAKRVILEKKLYPHVGNKIFKDLTYSILSDLVAEIYKGNDEKYEKNEKKRRRLKTDYSKRIASILNQIWKWAKRRGYCEKNVAEDLKEDFKSREIIKKHRPALLDPKSIGEFLNKIDIHIPRSSKAITEALILIVYLPVRSHEL
ncbi:MAG: Arm DNA-binding domain-containing protein, partial [Desulfovibrio sp.]|nr:Arm DNA-binding domain-containing protein [Desulfovibrio sp.]